MSSNRMLVAALIGFLAVGAVQIGLAISRGQLLIRAWWTDSDPPPAPAEGLATDGARIEEHPVEAAAIDGADPVRSASGHMRSGKPVAFVGGGHTQGGQSIAPDGLRVSTVALTGVQLDGTDVIVGAGATWAQVIEALRPAGRAPAVAPPYHDFTIGGSLSVDATSWMVHQPPISSSVESLTLVRPTGEVRTVTPDDPLFGLVLGGYGLAGLITDARLSTVPDERVTRMREVLLVPDLPAAWRAIAADPDTVLAHANVAVAPSVRNHEVVMTRYVRPTKAESESEVMEISSARAAYRAAALSDEGKEMRWRLLKADLSPRSTRISHVLDAGLVRVENRNPDATDVLHGFVIPLDGLLPFLDAAFATTATHDLLDIDTSPARDGGVAMLDASRDDAVVVTLRYHEPDRTRAAAAQEEVGRALLAASDAAGGTPMLMYRLDHLDDIEPYYPRWPEFVAAKRANDPDGVLSNGLWTRYGAEYVLPEPADSGTE